jgi:hypothetical protein
MSRDTELHGARDLRHDVTLVHPVHLGCSVRRAASALLFPGRSMRGVSGGQQLRDGHGLQHEHVLVRAYVHDDVPVHRGGPRRWSMQYVDDALRGVPHRNTVRPDEIPPAVRHDDEHVRPVSDELSVPRGRGSLQCHARLHVTQNVYGVRGGAPVNRLGRRGEAFGEAEPGTKFRHVVLVPRHRGMERLGARSARGEAGQWRGSAAGWIERPSVFVE